MSIYTDADKMQHATTQASPLSSRTSSRTSYGLKPWWCSHVTVSVQDGSSQMCSLALFVYGHIGKTKTKRQDTFASRKYKTPIVFWSFCMQEHCWVWISMIWSRLRFMYLDYLLDGNLLQNSTKDLDRAGKELMGLRHGNNLKAVWHITNIPNFSRTVRGSKR